MPKTKSYEVNDVTKRFLDTYDYLKDKGIIKSKRDFVQKIGVSPSIFTEISKKRTNVGIKVIQKTLQSFPQLNPDWLITGEGEMLRSGADERPASMVPAPEGRGIPLVQAQANAGHGNFDLAALAKDVKEHYVIPKFRHMNVDFLIEITGNSMAPKYYSGDIVAVRRLENPNYIQWNRPHLIGTRDQGLLVKRILPGNKKDHYTLKSDNPDYPPFEIPKSDITGIGLIVGVIRAE